MIVFLVFFELLRDRLMVGHIPLEDDILVRVQVPQQITINTMHIFLTNFLVWIQPYKYIVLFFGAIVEGPMLMMASGFLYHLGQFDFLPMYIALMGGDFVADIGWYCLGRFGGQAFIFKYSYLFHITRETLEKVESRFKKYHQKILIISKLTMGFGFSHAVLTVAGIFRVPFKNYAMLNLFGGFIWTLFLLTIGYFFGNVYAIIPAYAKVTFVSIGLIIIISALWSLNNYLKKQTI
jgi:membrane protein DedA with SNARE-associated domain